MKIKTSKDYIIEGKLIKKDTIISIEENLLKEMAKSLGEIKEDLLKERVVREEHLIKLFYYKGQTHYKENFRGWVDSAKKGFNHIAKKSNNNKYPTKEEIFNCIWVDYEDSFDDFHKSFIQDLNNDYVDFLPIAEIKLDEVRNFVMKYNKWASENLSKSGNINSNEAINKIKNLLELE